MKRIIKAEARPGYVLWVRFEDDAEGEVDLSHLVGKGVFQRWADPGEFEKVFVDPETRTVAWPGGIDLCPDSLHEDVTDTTNDRLRREYDFSGGERGKYAQRYAEGADVVVLDPDVAQEFPNSKAVNDALRAIVQRRQGSEPDRD
jgi:hypothetical protein